MKKRSRFFWRVVFVLGVAAAAAIGITGERLIDRDSDNGNSGFSNGATVTEADIRGMRKKLIYEPVPFPVHWWDGLADEDKKLAYDIYFNDLKKNEYNFKMVWVALSMGDRIKTFEQTMNRHKLGKLKPGPGFLKALSDLIFPSPYQQTRELAVKRIREMDGPEAVKLLRSVIKGPNEGTWPETKRTAVSELFKSKAGNRDEVIESLILDSAVGVELRRRIISRFSSRNPPSPEIAEVLRKMVQEEKNDRIRRAAENVLSRCGLPVHAISRDEVSDNPEIRELFDELERDRTFPLKWWSELSDEDKKTVHGIYKELMAFADEEKKWAAMEYKRRGTYLWEKVSEKRLQAVLKEPGDNLGKLMEFIKSTVADKIKTQAVKAVGASGSGDAPGLLDGLARDGKLGSGVQRAAAEELAKSPAPGADAVCAKFLREYEGDYIKAWLIKKLDPRTRPCPVVTEALIELARQPEGGEDQPHSAKGARRVLDRFGIEYKR